MLECDSIVVQEFRGCMQCAVQEHSQAFDGWKLDKMGFQNCGLMASLKSLNVRAVFC